MYSIQHDRMDGFWIKLAAVEWPATYELILSNSGARARSWLLLSTGFPDFNSAKSVGKQSSCTQLLLKKGGFSFPIILNCQRILGHPV